MKKNRSNEIKRSREGVFFDKKRLTMISQRGKRASAEGLEPPTTGFGDRRSTIRAMRPQERNISILGDDWKFVKSSMNVK